jgi:hypothetical protein
MGAGTSHMPLRGDHGADGIHDDGRWIWLNPVAVATPVTITATYESVSVSTSLTIVPASLASVSLSPRVVACGQSVTGTVVLDSPAPAGGATVQLASTTGAAVPRSVSVPSGSDRATFSVRTGTLSPSPGSSPVTATVTATYRGTSRQATVKCS